MNNHAYDESLVRYKIDFDENRFFKELENNEFCRFEGPMVPQFIFPVVYGIVYVKNVIGSVWSKIIIPSKDDYGSYFVPKEEAIELSKKYIVKMRNPKSLKRFTDLWEDAKKESLKTFAKIEKKPTKENYLKLNDDYLWLATLRVILDPLIAVSEDFVLPFYKKKLKINDNAKFEEVIKTFSTPRIMSWMVKEKKEKIGIAMKYFDDIKAKKYSKNLMNDLKEHAKKYFWITNNYKKANVLDEKYFLKDIASEIKNKTKTEISKEYSNLANYKKNLAKKRKKLEKELKLSKEDLKLLKILEVNGIITDEWKELNIRSIHYIDVLLKEFSKKTKVSVKDLYYYTFKEILELLKGKKADKKEIQKRKKEVLFMLYNKKVYFFSDANFDAKLRKYLFKENKNEIIKGFTASHGTKEKYIGKVKIILDSSKQNFPKGYILVTSMTRPEFMPSMKKALAVITNEGGITSHAAIVSRELNIPCIIGTKTATDVLKDNDLVEINVKDGTIKKIK